MILTDVSVNIARVDLCSFFLEDLPMDHLLLFVLLVVFLGYQIDRCEVVIPYLFSLFCNI